MADRELSFTSMNMSAVKTKFPSEYRRSFLESLDKKFLMIFGILFILFSVFFAIMASRPVPEITKEEIAKNRERFARLVHQVEKKKEKPKKVEEDAGEEEIEEDEETEEKKEEKVEKKETVVQREKRREQSKERRSAQVNAAKKKMASVGLFAALTASSGDGASGMAAVDDLISSSSLGDVDISSGGLATKKEDVALVLGSRGERKKVGSIKTSRRSSVSSKSLSTGKRTKIESRRKRKSGGNTRSVDDITRVLKKASKKATRLFARAQKKNPDLKGMIKIMFDINPLGKVENVRILKETVGDSRFISRIKKLYGKLKFGASKNWSRNVEVPLVFQ